MAETKVKPQETSNPYKFSVYPSDNQTALASTSSNTVNFNTEIYDTNSNFDTGAYSYTIPVTGYYHLDAHIRIDGLMTSYSFSIENSNIRKNYATQSGSALAPTLSGDDYLTAGTVLKVKIYGVTSSGTWQIIADSCWFSGHLISTS